MTREEMVRVGLRGIAVVVALLAFVDPAIAFNGVEKPTVVVMTADSARDDALAARVASSLEKRFVVSRGPMAGADASVIVGDAPVATENLATPVFAVAAERPSITIDALEAPATAPLDGRVRVEALVRVVGAKGRTVDVSLRADSLLVDHASRAVARDDDTLSLPLGFVPTARGVVRLRVEATIAGLSRGVDAATIVEVRDRRWNVLFYDARPSWGSRFIRRAIEGDPRFTVASRTVTSRNVSSDVGRPARLDDAPSIAGFDAIVVGAADALGESEVRGLEQFMRRRGGAVILPLDQRDPAPPARLTDVARWVGATADRPTLIRVPGDSGSLRAMSLAWPAQLPAAAQIIAGDTLRPVVWRMPIGAGQLVVSGALDAWRFRDPSEAAFDDVWRGVIAEGANAALAPIVATVTPTLARPGETMTVHVTLRDLAIAGELPAHTEIALSLDGTPLRAWPGGVGRFDAVVRAPRDTGIHHLAVSIPGTSIDVPVAVDRNAPIQGISATLFPRWIASHGGTIVAASELGDLAPPIGRALRVAPRTETHHPMRSPWWIIPFTLALSAEWWLRRRRGLR